MKLRNYQEYAVKSFFDYFSKGGEGNPLIVMPTGVGKSLVISKICQDMLTNWPGTKVLMLTHVKELIAQNYEKLLAVWPEAPVGIYSAGLGKKEYYFPITFAGIDSIANLDLDKLGRIDLIVVDECHLISPKENTVYNGVINALKERNSSLVVVGLTATDYRLGHGRLTNKGHIFTDVCCDMSSKDNFNWFIDEGYLVPLIPKKADMEVDTSAFKIRGGEFLDKDAQEAFDKYEVTLKACTEIIKIAELASRNHILIFATGIEHATHVREMMEYLEVPCGLVHSKMPSRQRDEEIQAFKDGEYRAIVNNGVLTTGFDYPQIDLIAVLRATNSTGLWVQILGRGTRPYYAPGYDLETKEGRLAAIKNSEKPNCIVLDFAGNTRRLGPINNPVIPQPKGSSKSGDAPVKICPNCSCYNHASVRFCEYCNEEFPRYLQIKEHASTNELIERDESVFTNLEVDKILYKVHQKSGKPPMLKVTYYCQKKQFVTFVCLEHEGYAGKVARDWWRKAADNFKVPRTIEEALERLKELRRPKYITIKSDEKFSEIAGYEYESDLP